MKLFSLKMKFPLRTRQRAAKWLARLGTDHNGNQVVLNSVRELKAGEVVDLTKDIQANYDFYTQGPGYKANE